MSGSVKLQIQLDQLRSFPCFALCNSTAHPNWQRHLHKQAQIMQSFQDGGLLRLRVWDKKGSFRRVKEHERQRNLQIRCKRKFEKVGEDVENANDRRSDFKLSGRRVVELDLLVKVLDEGCKACGNPLQLSNCFHETVSGLGSLLYLTCANGECAEINVCKTNKTHRIRSIQRGRPIFDVNTKLAAGILARLFNLLYVQNYFTDL